MSGTELLIRWLILMTALALLSKLGSARSEGKWTWVYHTILFAGLLGGAYGLVMDQVTCTLSKV